MKPWTETWAEGTLDALLPERERVRHKFSSQFFLNVFPRLNFFFAATLKGRFLEIRYLYNSYSCGFGIVISKKKSHLHHTHGIRPSV